MSDMQCNFCGTVFGAGWKHSCTADQFKQRIAEQDARIATLEAALGVAREALEKIALTMHQTDHRDGESGTEWDMRAIARECLAALEGGK